MFVCSDTESGGVSPPVNWTKGRRLGFGAYGQVYQVFDKDTGRDLAVKEMLIHHPLNETSKVQCSMFRIFLYTNRLRMVKNDMKMFNKKLDYRRETALQPV